MKTIGNILAAFLFFQPFLADGQPVGNTYGLIIGVADYTYNHKLQFSDKDALEFYFYLKKIAHSDDRKIFMLLNKQATREHIADKFTRIVNAAQEGDRVFIYFSGHGDIEQYHSSDNFFLLLANSSTKNYMTKPNELLDKIFFDIFIQRLLTKKVKVIFICDACHAGSLIGGEGGKKATLSSVRQSWTSEVKLLSCQQNEQSQESTKWGEGRGVFSFYLILGIEGLADKNGDGQVSLIELQDYLTRQVREGVIGFGMSQQPEIVGQNDFIISKTWPSLVEDAVRQVTSNLASVDYRKLNGSKGAKVEIGNNAFIIKNNLPGEENNYLSIELGSSITDNYWKSVYYSFKEKIESGNLLLPKDNSAYYYYNLFTQHQADTIQAAEMRATLVTALLGSYDDLLNPLYNEDTTAFQLALRTYDDRNLTIAAGLAADTSLLSSTQLQAKLLFLQACRLPAGVSDSLALPVLEQTIALDSTCPAYYLQLGRCHVAKMDFTAATIAYQHYVNILPNDEHGHNNLGLVYLATGRNNVAIDEFKTALDIDPSSIEAKNNLRLAMDKTK